MYDDAVVMGDIERVDTIYTFYYCIVKCIPSILIRVQMHIYL